MRSAAGAPPTREADAFLVLLPGRQVGHELEPKRRTGLKHARDGLERGGQIALGEQRLEHPVRRHHERKPAFACPANPARQATARLGGEKGQVSDVAADQSDTSTQPGAPDPLAGTGEHRLRSINAHDRDAGATERDRDAPGAAPEFEDRSIGLQGKVAPEGNVAPAERSRVLPVVERRVVVPAFVAFSHVMLQTCNAKFKLQNSNRTYDHPTECARVNCVCILNFAFCITANQKPPIPPERLDVCAEGDRGATCGQRSRERRQTPRA